MDMLDLYSDYLIFQNKYATATGLSDLVDGAFAHDKVTRFSFLAHSQTVNTRLKPSQLPAGDG